MELNLMGSKLKSEKRLIKYYGLACIPLIFIAIGFVIFLFLLPEAFNPPMGGTVINELFSAFLFSQTIFILYFPYFYINLLFVIIVIIISNLMQKPKVVYIRIADIGFIISLILFIYWTFFHNIDLGEGGA